LLIEKSDSGGLSFWHADGTVYGGRPSMSEADIAARTFRGLRNLGFGEREAREAVREAGAHVGNDRSVESLLRIALEQLTRNGWEKAS
jgi:Holliday junction resolvasome RuvABC DNA-binding subunit